MREVALTKVGLSSSGGIISLRGEAQFELIIHSRGYAVGSSPEGGGGLMTLFAWGPGTFGRGGSAIGL